MPLTLSPELETQLSAVAAQRGLPPLDVLAQLLSEAAADYTDAEQQEQEKTLAALRRSAAQFAAGQWVTVEDLQAEHDTWKAAHLPTGQTDAA